MPSIHHATVLDVCTSERSALQKSVADIKNDTKETRARVDANSLGIERLRWRLGLVSGLSALIGGGVVPALSLLVKLLTP